MLIKKGDSIRVKHIPTFFEHIKSFFGYKIPDYDFYIVESDITNK